MAAPFANAHMAALLPVHVGPYAGKQASLPMHRVSVHRAQIRALQTRHNFSPKIHLIWPLFLLRQILEI